MNIDELEKLARAAKHDNDSLIVGPAAILELIELVRTLRVERDKWVKRATGESDE